MMTRRTMLLAAAGAAVALPTETGLRQLLPAAHAATGEKRIALSFDDVPRGAGAFLPRTERPAWMLGALRDAKVEQAVFFLNPARIDDVGGAQTYIESYVRAGHVIANHSFTHPHLSTVSADAYLADIDKAETWLRGREGYRPWFRYPFLDEGGKDKAKRDAVRGGLAARRLSNGYCTVDGSDWHIEDLAVKAQAAGKAIDMKALRDLYVETHVESSEFAHALAKRAVGRAIPHVMLLHETDLAALFLVDLVEALRAKGWTTISADTAYADPVYRSLPDTPYANGTLTEMLAWEQGLPAPRWYERNDTELATKLFRQRVLHEEIG